MLLWEPKGTCVMAKRPRVGDGHQALGHTLLTTWHEIWAVASISAEPGRRRALREFGPYDSFFFFFFSLFFYSCDVSWFAALPMFAQSRTDTRNLSNARSQPLTTCTLQAQTAISTKRRQIAQTTLFPRSPHLGNDSLTMVFVFLLVPRMISSAFLAVFLILPAHSVLVVHVKLVFVRFVVDV